MWRKPLIFHNESIIMIISIVIKLLQKCLIKILAGFYLLNLVNIYSNVYEHMKALINANLSDY